MRRDWRRCLLDQCQPREPGATATVDVPTVTISVREVTATPSWPIAAVRRLMDCESMHSQSFEAPTHDAGGVVKNHPALGASIGAGLRGADE